MTFSLPNTPRASQIASIIAQRQPLAEKIEKIIVPNLRSIADALKALEINRQSQLEYWKNQPEVVTGLQNIDFSEIQQRIADELKVLDNLQERFFRNTLNIGVVGRMGQGKSTLLKSLTQLSDDEIPARKGKACTAVRSTIYHQPGNVTKALVTYYTEDSFLKEVIQPYFTEILKLSPYKPNTLNEFKTMQLEKPDYSSGEATNKTIHERLYKDYYLNLRHYFVLLGKQPEWITQDKIKEYVSQEEENGKLKDSKHLAVRKVEIYCTFPKADEIGQIALVDIPGLGDFKLGDEQLMLKTLAQEVDVVLFIRKPDEDRYNWSTEDTKLYEKAGKELNDLPARSFIVFNNKVNADGSGNIDGCKVLKAEIEEQRIKMQFAECIIANCADSQQANQILDKVLNHLQVKITELDTKYVSSCFERLIQLLNDLKAELNRTRVVLNIDTENDGHFGLFQQLFNQLLADMGLSLITKLGEFEQDCEKSDDEFKKHIAEVIQTCKDNPGIPSITDIKGQIALSDGCKPAYYHFLSELRSHLSQQFSSLEEKMQRSLEKQKDEVAEVLIKQGKLGKLTTAQGSEFFKIIAELIPTQLLPGQPSKLKSGFQNIYTFSHSSHVPILETIQKQLDVLNADTDTFSWSEKPTEQDVHNYLNALHKKAIFKCENELEALINAPNKTASAMLKAFVEQVIRTNAAKDEWRGFFYLTKVRAKVWDEFAVYEKRVQQQQEWLESVDKVYLLIDSKLYSV